MDHGFLPSFVGSFGATAIVVAIGLLLGWSDGAVGVAIIGATALGLFIADLLYPPAPAPPRQRSPHRST